MGTANSIVKVVSGNKKDFDWVRYGEITFTIKNGVAKLASLDKTILFDEEKEKENKG